MQLLTIRINNRINKILNFSNKKWSNNNTFIIRGRNIDGTRELFSIKQNADLIDGKEHRDVRVNDIQIEGNKVRVFLETGKWKKIDCDNFKLDSQRNEYVFSTTEPTDSDCIEVEFHLDGSNNHFSIYMYFAPTVYDAIIDFGSEASQACWYQNENKKDVNITQGIHDFIKVKSAPTPTAVAHQSESAPDAASKDVASKKEPQDKSKEEPIEIKDYVQYESDTLYKSIYYMKKNLGKTKLNAWPDYKSDTIRFLVSNKEEEAKLRTEYFLLPNAKLSYFDILKNTTLTYNGKKIKWWQLPGERIIERILLNNIVLQTLLDIQNDADVEAGENDADVKARENNAYVVLNVLMPNVYPIHVVSEKLNLLAEDINTLLKNSAYKEDFKRIRAVELRSVSESDASLLGYANYITSNDQALIPGNYLIMDAGKGTLDFSLMGVSPDDDHGYVNKSRAGIIGAGNAITYGLIIGLVNDYLSQVKKDDYPEKPEDQADLIRQFIYDNILGKGIDVAILRKFNNAVEEYKKIYNKLYETSAMGASTDAETDSVVEASANGNSADAEPKPTGETSTNGNSADAEPKPTGETSTNGTSDQTEPKPTGKTSADGNTPNTQANEELRKITMWVESLCSSRRKLTETSCKFVTIEIKNIAAEAIGKMAGIFNCIQKYTKEENEDPLVDFVVFTGRGFLMKEFQMVMMDYLKKAKIVKQDTDPEKDSDPIIPSGDRMKTDCLNIIQKLTGGKYDASPSRQTIGILSNIDENKGKKQNKKVSGRGKPKSEGKPDSPNPLDILDILGGYNNNNNNNNNRRRVVRGYSDGDFEKDGIEIDGNLIISDSSLSIGGWLYSINGEFKGHTSKVFFDGLHYWITAEGVESQELGGGSLLKQPDYPLCFESLFPEVSVERKEDIIIPEESKLHMAFQSIITADDIEEQTGGQEDKQKPGIVEEVKTFFLDLFKRVD